MAVGAACVGTFETCEQRNTGAFGPNGGANKTITAIGSSASIIGGAAPAKLASVFTVPPTVSNPSFDGLWDLPGPGAVVLSGSLQTCAVATACP